MTTQELVERLRAMVALKNETPRIPALPRVLAIRAADRLSEMDAEIKRLREALKPFAAQTRASSLAEEKMILAARAALEHQQKGEGL